MLTEEQAKTVKKQIIHHIEESFPEDKKEFARKRVESMTSSELEEFLVKNNLGTNQAGRGTQGTNTKSSQCVFCSIVSGEIASNKIAENESAIAVLEINPVSRGHVLVIPKEHTSSHDKEPAKETKKLIKDVSGMIKKKLKPKTIILSPSNLFGHEITNIIPQFTNETVDSQRHHATPEEISELHLLLDMKNDTSEKKSKRIKVKKAKREKISEKMSEKMWLPRRIP